MFARQLIPYDKTNSFSKIVIDYLHSSDQLKPFYSFAPTVDGVKEAIDKKKKHKINRSLLKEQLKNQYAIIAAKEPVQKNIDLLEQENTFTVCTAHQPNLFTGPLYFMYKILHTIKLAAFLKEKFPENNF